MAWLRLSSIAQRLVPGSGVVPRLSSERSGRVLTRVSHAPLPVQPTTTTSPTCLVPTQVQCRAPQALPPQSSSASPTPHETPCDPCEAGDASPRDVSVATDASEVETRAAERAASLLRSFKLPSSEQMKEYVLVAQSLQHTFNSMAAWSLPELVRGLSAVNTDAASRGDPVAAGMLHPCAGRLQSQQHERLVWAGRINTAVYRGVASESAPGAGDEITSDSFVHHHPSAEPFKPAYAILVDHPRRCVVLAIRGTHEVHDIITDAAALVDTFHDGFVHRGMHLSARWLYATQCHHLYHTLERYPKYAVLLTGHSLGAGTAAILGSMLRDAPRHPSLASLSVIAFSSAAAMSDALSERVAPWTTSIVMGDDLFARMSLRHLEEVRETLLEQQQQQQQQQQHQPAAFPALAKMRDVVDSSTAQVTELRRDIQRVAASLNADACAAATASSEKLAAMSHELQQLVKSVSASAPSWPVTASSLEQSPAAQRVLDATKRLQEHVEDGFRSAQQHLDQGVRSVEDHVQHIRQFVRSSTEPVAQEMADASAVQQLRTAINGYSQQANQLSAELSALRRAVAAELSDKVMLDQFQSEVPVMPEVALVKLYPPGSVYYLSPCDPGAPQAGATLWQADLRVFDRFLLSRYSLQHHLLSNVLAALQHVRLGINDGDDAG